MTYTTRTTLRATAGLLLLSVIPAVSADCFIDDFDREVCTGISTGARVGIAFGVFFLVFLLLLALGITRRRRIQRANQAYITNANATQNYPAPGYTYNQNSYNPTNVPQYPPQSHPGQYNGAQGYNADPFAQPPAGTPPQYPSYAPPPGVPPMDKQ